jgi:hypothetical protein
MWASSTSRHLILHRFLSLRPRCACRPAPSNPAHCRSTTRCSVGARIAMPPPTARLGSHPISSTFGKDVAPDSPNPLIRGTVTTADTNLLTGDAAHATHSSTSAATGILHRRQPPSSAPSLARSNLSPRPIQPARMRAEEFRN